MTKTEKAVFYHVREHEEKQPRNISPQMFHYSLATLQEKGLVKFLANYEEILSAELTIKGIAYMEQNPALKNPVDWKGILSLAAAIITAIATGLMAVCALC